MLTPKHTNANAFINMAPKIQGDHVLVSCKRMYRKTKPFPYINTIKKQLVNTILHAALKHIGRLLNKPYEVG